ncbi:MAG TPA: FG-GAP-like repeat-containing protein [Tepidisphaeraceae bacterium]|nr:FG-GAP-like repeat-containing protein [Tepidisphaeraceae bacterium]
MASIAFTAPVTSDIATLDFAVVTTAVGDLNGDGIPDVVAGRDNLEAQVYLGASTGVLSPSVIVATGGSAIALGDFNGDGTLDLATADGILPGLGNGTFGTAIAGFTLPANTANLYAEDVNGDGNLDLVAATFTPGSGSGTTAINPAVGLSVLLGNGNGTFQSPIPLQVGASAAVTSGYATFAFGSFDNNNGNLDILTPFGLMLGDGDGTFSAPIGIPYKSNGTSAPALPSSPLLAVGDFNGDGNLDFAAAPVASGTGQVELFLGDGTGGFTDNGPLTIGSGDTVVSLAANDLLSTGQSDLIAGVITSAGADDLAVLNNSGNTTFGAPMLYTLPGAPLNLTAVDFNGDGVTDLLSVNEAAGGLAGGQAVSASVLLGTQNAGAVPTVNVRASANPVIVGESVQFFANVITPSGSTVGSPTGNVTFLDGATTLGTAALVNGKANLTTTAAGIGTQAITVQYSGDSNYASATSNDLSLIVLVSGAKQPLLVPTLGAVTLPTEFLPGDTGTVSIVITNGGDAAGSGKVSVNLFLSSDGAIDSTAIPISVPALQNRAVHLGRGAAATLKAKVSAGDVPAGGYMLIAQLVPVAVYTADEVSQAPVVGATTLQAAGMVFGDIGTHNGLKLKAADASGNVATFSISGPGSGAVTEVNGIDQVAVTGVTSASKLNIANHGAFTLGALTIDGSLNDILAHSATLGGDLTIGGAVKSITLAGIAASDGGSVAIDLGAGETPTLSLGAVATATLTSAAAIKSLLANAWQAGAIDAPSIGALTVKGAFGADVRTHSNGAVASAKFGSIVGGTWAVAGAINSIRVTGDVSDATIFAGADTGADDVLGTSDDIFTAAVIGAISVGGADTSTLIVAGGSFPAGADPIFGNVTLLPGGAIHAIVVKGVAGADSHFLADKLPHTASLDRVATTTATDPRFAD